MNDTSRVVLLFQPEAGAEEVEGDEDKYGGEAEEDARGKPERHVGKAQESVPEPVNEVEHGVEVCNGLEEWW